MAISDSDLVEIVNDQDFISTDGFFKFASTNDDYCYWKRDFLFKSGEWRSKRVDSYLFRQSRSHKTLIIGHSDLYLHSWQATILRAAGTKRIYATNADPVNRFVTPIPQGLTNYCTDSPAHKILGNPLDFVTAWTEQEARNPFNGETYVNFTVDTHKLQRNSAADAARLSPRSVFRRYPISSEGRVNYLKDLRKYNFVLCPRGNGMDTVRVWETLYMGGFPVIIKTPYMESILTGLPVLWISKWQEILDQDFLASSWHQLNSNIHYSKSLRLTHWVEVIEK